MTGAAVAGDPVRIRRATAGDGPVLRDLERRAGARFASVGMAEIAADEPMSVDDLAGYAADGRSAVAAVDTGQVVGYVLVDRVDGAAHVEQISVDPEHQGRGIARQLLAWVDEWARAARCRAVTLTTFRDVPWNAPLYAHLGFRELADDEIGPDLAAVVSDEAAHGLEPTTRLCMRRAVP